MAKVKVQVIRMNKDKQLPKYETVGAAGLDVRADFARLTPENPIQALEIVSLYSKEIIILFLI